METAEKHKRTHLLLLLPLVSGLALITALSFSPVAGATSCSISWNMPSGPYNPGNPVTATVTEACKGPIQWDLVNSSAVSVASGTVNCPCSSKTLFSYTAGSSPIPPGSYSVSASWNGGSIYKYAFTVSDFLVTNELPLGAAAAVGVSLIGLVAVRRLGKGFANAIPTK